MPSVVSSRLHVSLLLSSSPPPAPSSTCKPWPKPYATVPFSPLLSSSTSASLLRASSRSLRIAAAWQQPIYVYPDPIPEFAEAEARKFESELRKELLRNKEVFGEDVDAVVEVCTEILNNFLHKEYGGPGTFVVEPFTDMLLELKENKLSGATLAARAALLWAQNYLDQDWEIWNSQPS